MLASFPGGEHLGMRLVLVVSAMLASFPGGEHLGMRLVPC